MFTSILSQIKCKTTHDEKGFTAPYLRRMAIMHFIDNVDILLTDIRSDIRYLYGLVDSDTGPFSVKEYLKFMSADKEWGDSIILKLISSMWAVRIGVLRSDSLSLVTYRNNEDIMAQEILLLYNCNMINGHYTAIGRRDNIVCKCKKVEISDGYDLEVDMMERRSRGDMFGSEYEVGDMVTIPTHRYEYLCEIEKKYFEVQKLVGVEEGEGIKVHEKKKSNIGRPKGRKEKELPKDVQEVQKGDTVCNKCNMDYLSTHGLKRHINAFHLGQLNYVCNICDKEFLTKEGIKMHMVTHGTKKEFTCTFVKPDKKVCGTRCSSLKSLKKHKKNIHGKQQKFKCNFCKVFITNTKDNLKQHHVRCPSNPDKPEYWCDLCTAGPWPVAKFIKYHKQEDHSW